MDWEIRIEEKCQQLNSFSRRFITYKGEGRIDLAYSPRRDKAFEYYDMQKGNNIFSERFVKI